jgi:tetratricopeptide (TPR) repeat protein
MNTINKLKHSLSVLACIICFSPLTKAQRTNEYSNAINLFEHAKMLYVKKQYVPAINEFNSYLSTAPGPNFTYASKAYIGLARLKLDKQGASRELAKMMRGELNHPLNTEITYELGLYHYNKGKYTRSLKYFEQVEEVDIPKHQREELAFKKGYAYFKNNEFKKAKGQFKKVMNGGGKYAVEANYYFGYQCYILKDYACAFAIFSKIGDKGPKTMKLYLAQMYYEQEEYEKAFDIIKNVSLKKRDNEIQLLTGKIHYQLGNMSVAKSHFDKYNGDIKSLRSNEIYQFANANFTVKDYTKSTQYFILIANEDNEIGQAANYQIGVADVSIGQKERALNAFAEAKRKDFDKNISDIAAFNYAKLAAELQKNATAIRAIKEYLDKYPNSENINAAKSIMADIFLSTKNYKAAIKILEEIGSLNDDAKQVYQELTFHRAEELYLNKQYQDADVFFKKSLKYIKDPKLEALSYFWRAEIAYKVDDNDGSINLMNRFMSINDDQVTNKNTTHGYYSMGYNYFKKKNYPKAQNYFAKFKQFEKFSSANKDVYLDNIQRLADCYFLNGQYSPAIDEYNFIIKNDYKNADYAIFQQGMLLGLQDQHLKKINVLKQIPKDFQRSIYVDDALYQTAREYMNIGNYSAAENIFNSIISQHDYSPFLPESYLKLGLISYNQSKDDAALRYYKTVVDRFQNTKESKEALSFIEIIYTNQGNPNAYFEYAKNIAGAGITITYQDSVIYQQAMRTYNSENFSGASKELDGYIKKFGDNGAFIIAAHYFKAECDFYTDKEDIALTHYDYVASQSTNTYTNKSLIKLSGTYFYRKEYAKAIDYYARLEPIAASKSTFLKAIMGQMRAHYLQKEYDKAKEKAIQLLPIQAVPTEDLVEANIILGKVQLKDSNLRSARFHFDYVIENSRNEKTAEALFTRSLINFEQEYLDSARADVYRLQDDFSAYEFWVVKGFILLSDIYVKENDLFQAKATLQSIIDNYDKEDDGLLDICSLKLKQIEAMETPKDTLDVEEE